MIENPVQINCLGTIEKVQNLASGAFRVYLDVDMQQVAAAARLLAEASRPGKVFKITFEEQPGAFHGAV